jgi:preprotein translocase subunit YajC
VDTTWLNCFVLSAQENGGGAGGSWPLLVMPWLAIGFLFYFLLWRPQQRERARRQAMLDGLKKNDRVIAAGGIYGVVADVDREANRVTLKVDETTNAKLRVTLSSVVPLPSEEPSGDKSGS